MRVSPMWQKDNEYPQVIVRSDNRDKVMAMADVENTLPRSPQVKTNYYFFLMFFACLLFKLKMELHIKDDGPRDPFTNMV